jgi:hypothetical protein
MQPCYRIYYSIVHRRLNMFLAAHRSSSGALTVFAASGLHTPVVTSRGQVWVGTSSHPELSGNQFPLRIDYCRSPYAYVNQRLQIQLELLMMSGLPLETCWGFNERWNNKFYYKVASCWLFLLSHTTMHGSMYIKCNIHISYDNERNLKVTSHKIILMCVKVTFALILICSTCLFGHACVKKEKLLYGQLDPLQTLKPLIINVLASWEFVEYISTRPSYLCPIT